MLTSAKLSFNTGGFLNIGIVGGSKLDLGQLSGPTVAGAARARKLPLLATGQLLLPPGGAKRVLRIYLTAAGRKLLGKLAAQYRTAAAADDGGPATQRSPAPSP